MKKFNMKKFKEKLARMLTKENLRKSFRMYFLCKAFETLLYYMIVISVKESLQVEATEPRLNAKTVINTSSMY